MQYLFPQIEKTVVNLKKDKILKSYMSDELIADMVNSGTLLGMERASEDVETDEAVVNDVEMC